MSEVPELGIRLVPEGFDELLAKIKFLEERVNAYLQKVERVYKESLKESPTPTREEKVEKRKEEEGTEEDKKEKKEQTWTLKKILGILGLGYISWRVGTKYSAYMASALRTLDTFIGLTLAPFFNIVGALLMPFLIMMIEYVAVPFYKFMAPIAKWFMTDPVGKILGRILGAILFISALLVAWKGTSVIFGAGKIFASMFGGAGTAVLGGLATKLLGGGGAPLASTVPGWFYGSTSTGGALASLSALAPMLALIGGMFAGGLLIKATTGDKLEKVLDALYEERTGPAKGVYGWARWFLGATKGTVFEPFGYFISGFVGMVTDISERIAGGVVNGIFWLGKALNPFKPIEDKAEEASERIEDLVGQLKEFESNFETGLPTWAEEALNDLSSKLNELSGRFSSLSDELDRTITRLGDVKMPSFEEVENKLEQLADTLGGVTMPDLSALEELNKTITEVPKVDVNANIYVTIDPSKLQGIYGIDLSSAIAEYYTEVSTRVGGRH